MRKGRMCGVVLTVFVTVTLVGGFSALAQGQLVHFKELITIIAVDPPEGWKLSQKPKGTTMKSPMQMSEAEVEFQSGDKKKIEIKIVDGLGGMIPFVGMIRGMEMESSEEYLKPIEIQGFKGTEKFQHKNKEGEIILPVANRFLITIEGEGMDNTEVLKDVAGKLDLKKLSGMGK